MNMMTFPWDFGPKSFRHVFNWYSFTFLNINSTSQWTRQLGYFHIAITKLWRTSTQEQDPRQSAANDQTACKWHLIPHPKKNKLLIPYHTIPFSSFFLCSHLFIWKCALIWSMVRILQSSSNSPIQKTVLLSHYLWNSHVSCLNYLMNHVI